MIEKLTTESTSEIDIDYKADYDELQKRYKVINQLISDGYKLTSVSGGSEHLYLNLQKRSITEKER